MTTSPTKKSLMPLDRLGKSVSWWREFYDLVRSDQNYVYNAVKAGNFEAFNASLALDHATIAHFKNTCVLKFAYISSTNDRWDEIIWMTKPCYDLIDAFIQQRSSPLTFNLGDVFDTRANVYASWDELLVSVHGPDPNDAHDAFITDSGVVMVPDINEFGGNPLDWHVKNKDGYPKNWEDSVILNALAESAEFDMFCELHFITDATITPTQRLDKPKPKPLVIELSDDDE